MAFSNITTSSITKTSVTIGYTYYNDQSQTIMVSLWKNEDLFARMAAPNGVNPYYSRSFGNASTFTGSYTITGLTAGTSYNFAFSVVKNTAAYPFDPNYTQMSGSWYPLVFSQNISVTTLQDAPSWTNNTASGSARIGSSYSSSISATGSPTYSFSNLPPGITQSGSSGSISGTPTSTGSYLVSASATNGGGTINTSFYIDVSPRLPVWTDNTLSSTLRVGTAYSDSVLANYASSYSVSSGTIPAGLTFNTSTGLLSGTPTTADSYTFKISAKNTANETITATFTSYVVKPRLPVWTDDSISTFFEVDNPYSDSISADYASSYAISSGTIPAGVTLNTSTGALSGIPTIPGTYVFVLSAKNSANESITTAQFSIEVVESGGKIYVYNGSAWIESVVYARGTSWSVAKAYYYNGSSWVKTT